MDVEMKGEELPHVFVPYGLSFCKGPFLELNRDPFSFLLGTLFGPFVKGVHRKLVPKRVPKRERPIWQFLICYYRVWLRVS